MAYDPQIAAIRFGLGRRAGEAIPTDPQAWLARQLDGEDPGLAAPLHGSSAGLRLLHETRTRSPGKGPNSRQEPKDQIRDIFRADTGAALDMLLTTATPFRERLVWFWANHFTVSIRTQILAGVINAYVSEAIRPHVTGRFEDMLLAVMRHPAMLFYLNNAGSIGPLSPAGQRSKRGLNENLARECLELHTVTPASGYTQADVTEFARVLTGWSIDFERGEPGFIFRPATHEPGSKTVMGKSWPQGEAGGRALLHWLGTHPSTYRSVATKLVRHFVADAPAEADVQRIAGILQQTGGDLKAASLGIVGLESAWRPLGKLRSPFDYVVAVMRALDLPAERRGNLNEAMSSLGQGLHNAPLPNGWPDTAAEWAGPEAIMRRVDWAYAVAGRTDGIDPVRLARDALGPLLPADTHEAIARAGSHREAMTLLLASPEFQRR